MRMIRWYLRPAILLASIAASGEADLNQLCAQVDAWAIGDKAVVMPPGTGGAANQPFALPQPTDPAVPAALRYQGQVASQSQHVRTTGDGRILFFAVDGNLYDGDGYMIADARGTGCLECLEPGVMEFVSVPVPGSCNLFYLFSGVAKDASMGFFGSHVQWSILDMSADNLRFPASAPTTCARKGRLLSLVTDIGATANFSGWAFEFENPTGAEPTSDHMGALASISGSTAPRFRVVESANANGDHWLFTIIDGKVYVDRVSSNGIFRVQPITGQGWLDIRASINQSNQPFCYDADAILTSLPNRAEDVLALALTDGMSLYAYPNSANNVNNLLIHYFDRNTGALLLGDSKVFAVNTAPIGCSGGVNVALPNGGFITTSLRGCAFRSDGNGLYLTGERSTDCQTVQLTCSTWISIAMHLPISVTLLELLSTLNGCERASTAILRLMVQV